jgi:peptidoglycan/xylan/chitin deacetylase (PgdA/CDA1 family)
VRRLVFSALLFCLCSSLAAAPKAYGTAKGIPILMFHRFSPTSPSPYSITPAGFQKILEYLRDHKVCLVNLGEYAASNLGRCLGRKVVALSFDDGHPSQVGFLGNGRLDPNSGLGVLLRVFPKAKGTFFINTGNGGAPFGGQSKQKIQLLQKNGLELGNHTVSHPMLSRLSKKAVAREIDGVCAYLGQTAMLLAYPYGVMPRTNYKTRCVVSAAFRAWLGYFEGKGQTKKSGALLAPFPSSPDFKRRRLEYPRLNISSYSDFLRDVANNPNWVALKQ